MVFGGVRETAGNWCNSLCGELNTDVVGSARMGGCRTGMVLMGVCNVKCVVMCSKGVCEF